MLKNLAEALQSAHQLTHIFVCESRAGEVILKSMCAGETQKQKCILLNSTYSFYCTVLTHGVVDAIMDYLVEKKRN